MRQPLPQTLEVLFHQTETLEAIQQKAIALAKLNQTILSLLPNPLRAHCRVANLRQNTLVIEVDNANWLTMLRYEQDNLRQTLRASLLPSLVAIQMYINPDMMAQQHKIKQTRTHSNSIKENRTMSTESAAILSQFADKCPASLRNKLQNIIKLASKKS